MPPKARIWAVCPVSAIEAQKAEHSMQTEFFLMKLACFDNQNSRIQKRPALIHQQIPDERDCYSKQTSQPASPSFSSILVMLENSVFQYLHFHVEEFAANRWAARVAHCFLAYTFPPPGTTDSSFSSFCELNRRATAYHDPVSGQTED